MYTKTIFLLLFSPVILFSQVQSDTLMPTSNLKNVTISGVKGSPVVLQLPDVHQTFIVGGRKNEVVVVQDLTANLAEKTGRQIFAKIPGAFVYDMDGSGNQVNLATRGLDAHRSWEFNTRQNGVVMNSDMYGYPASHYSIPMEAIQKVEIVRGTAALQYGAQFGGMVNYITKTADTTKAVSFESLNSVGSFGLFSSYNAIGGKINKFRYYAYYHKRVSDGYRDNSSSSADAQFVSLQYDFTPRLSLRGELGKSQYLYQIPGPLTDSMFHENPRQSTRNRNYFSPNIYVPSVTLDWKIGDRTYLNWIASGVFGTRNSLQFEGFADKPDLIDPVTLQYKTRTVDIDVFRSRTSELRLLHYYYLGRFKNVVTSSIRYFNNNMDRKQQGKGTTGSNYDLTRTGEWGRDLNYKSQSIAFSIENMLYLTNNLTISPGFRYEYGQSDMTGRLGYLAPLDIPNQIQHRIPAFGVNAQFKPTENIRVFGGISQAYRPVLFKDIIPGSALEKANKDLKDAFGYNAEIGISGRASGWLKYDITLFRLQYNNRMGNLVISENNTNYIYKTNIGNSLTNGVEIYTELVPLNTHNSRIAVFTATSFMDAVYQNAKVAVGSENIDISGNAVESTPRIISRNGINAGYKKVNITLQYSYVDQSFADPTNVRTPTPNGAKGIVPAYGIFDLNAGFRIAERFMLRAGINNLANKQYFTKRPLIYPGPGVWSSDGRGWFVSFDIKI